MRTELKSSSQEFSLMPGVSHCRCSGARYFLLKVARILPLALMGAEVGLGCRKTEFPILSI